MNERSPARNPRSAGADRGVFGTGGGLPLGHVAGIEIRLDWSLLIIFALVTVSLALGALPQWHPDWGPGVLWATAAAASVLFFASVLAHELSHALVGRRLGIRVNRITLFVFGGMAHMEDEPPTWRSELGMAIAGPLASLLLGLVFLWLGAALAGPVPLDTEDPMAVLAKLGPLATICLWLGPVNLILAVFNLVPGFPLDGGRVLRAVLWGATGDLPRATRWAATAGQLFAWCLIASGFAMVLGLRVPVFGTGTVAGLWLALIGWFLNNAALNSYRSLLVREALEDLPVTRLMLPEPLVVAPDTSVEALVEERLMHSDQRAFPVMEDGRLLGLVTLQDVRRLARDAWGTTPLSRIMTPAAQLRTLPADAMASQALALLAEHDLNQVPVMDGERLLGLVSREGIVRWLALARPGAPGGEGTPRRH